MSKRLNLVLIYAACLLMLPLQLPAGPVTKVSGRILDAQNGGPLPFVSVIFLGSQIGTMSDDKGNFTLENDKGFVTLSFQMLGYETYVLPVTSN